MFLSAIIPAMIEELQVINYKNRPMQQAISRKIYSVSELTFSIKTILENNFKMVAIKGEISNFKHQSSGHLYFSLKDKESQIASVLFKGNARNLSRLPKDGDQVIAIGEVSVYPPRGNYQLIIRQLEFLGTGQLLLKLHEIKEELKLKGYFEKRRKKPLPFLPKTIGVITSPTGAVIQDVLNVLKRRYFNFHLILNPVKVQGEKAAEEIAQAISDFNKNKLADVLIVGRGGGSLEDLWAFNEKIVAEAIFNSQIPIISAVGHETDTCIADLVADLRAPTPSAAAEMVLSEKAILLKALFNYQNQIFNNISNLINYFKNHLIHLLKHPVIFSSSALLSKYWQQIDEYRNYTDSTLKHILELKKNIYISYVKQLKTLSPQTQINFLKQKLLSLTANLNLSIKNKITLLRKESKKDTLQNQLNNLILVTLRTKKENLKKLIAHLKSLDPKNLLKKGYSILFSEKDNSIILSSKELTKNQKIYALLHDGKIKATVEDHYE